jgi:hypothetical protein
MSQDAPSGGRAGIQTLRTFSQAEDEQVQPFAFDVAYAAEPVTTVADENQKAEDPLPDILMQ